MKELMDYKSVLDIKETQVAIKYVKDTFEEDLAKALNLTRVSAPLFVKVNSGLNDNLSGTEKAIDFKVKNDPEEIEIVHSLAKWKRAALNKYNFVSGEGLYTDMNAIRKDENPDFLHSFYVDQWDWERVINKEDRNLLFLKEIVSKIYSTFRNLSLKVNEKYPLIKHDLPKEITFVSTSELEDLYPNLDRKERENEITRKYKAVFLYQIGWPLKDNKPHDLRAADYDDWDLNGDILLYYPLLDIAFELSSMGIRVNKDSLVKQLEYKGELDKLNNPYCKGILEDKLPLTIGGGIGQSRLCMYLLNKAHIGEVQVSIWPEEDIESLKKKNIYLL